MASTPKTNDSVRVSSFLMLWEEFVKHRCEFFRELFARIHCGLTPSGPGVALLAEDPRGSALLPPRPRASGGHSPSSGPRGWTALFAQHGGGVASSPGLWLWPGWRPSLSRHAFLSPSSLLTCGDPEQRNSLTPTSTGCMWGLVGASSEVTRLRSLQGCGPCAQPPGRVPAQRGAAACLGTRSSASVSSRGFGAPGTLHLGAPTSPNSTWPLGAQH